MKMKSLIIDDEALSRTLLRSLLQEYCPQVELIEEASCYEDALELMEKYSPDILFLDIEMPNGDGFEFLHKVNSRKLMTVFVTAYGKYAIDAVREGAVDYLLKPLTGEVLQATVSNAYNRWLKEGLHTYLDVNELNRQIAIHHSRGFKVVSLHDIVRLEADNSYTFFYLIGDSKILVTKSISEAAASLLESQWFFRTHRSHVINFFYLKEYLKEDGGYALMQDGKRVSLSRLKMEEFLDQVNRFTVAV
jgi:two-component system LytT family response regulator